MTASVRKNFQKGKMMLINDKQCFLMLFICYVLEPKCDQMTASVQKKMFASRLVFDANFNGSLLDSYMQ